MSKIVSFKSSLRFSFWVVLASFLSVPLSHAMDKEEENKKPCPPLPYQMVQYIAGFVKDPNDLESMTLVNKTWNKGVKVHTQKIHKSIQEKMKSFDVYFQEFIRNVFGREIDCDKHTHFNVLKFMDCFNEDVVKYFLLDQEFLEYPNLSNFHKRTMMVNAVELGLFELCRSERIQVYETFSIKQMDILGKYGRSLIPELRSASDGKDFLESLKPFSVEKLDILGKYSILLIPDLMIGSYYKKYLEGLEPFTVKQLDILGKYGRSLIPEMPFGSCCKEYLEGLKPFSIEQLEAIGRNAVIIFTNVENYDRAEFIKKNLTNLTPKEIELFAQKKEKENK